VRRRYPGWPVVSSRDVYSIGQPKMNLRRGLFRLWIVGSALFVLAVAFVSYSEIKKQFDAAALMHVLKANEVAVPVLCADARGTANADYFIEHNDNCWYAMSKFRRLYPEYKDLSDNELTRKLYPARGLPAPNGLPNPWATLGTWASIAFGIPLAVLALGASLLWALSGFADERQGSQ
jgi:hypothetical protein